MTDVSDLEAMRRRIGPPAPYPWQSRLHADAMQLLALVDTLTAALAASEARVAELREAFVAHRTETHEVKPLYCVTCKRSDAAIAAVAPGTGDQEQGD